MKARTRVGLRWVLPLVCGALLAGIDLVASRVTQLRLLPRGSVAPYTIRAATDAVFDLRETYREEAKAARRNYVPVYNKDHLVFYDARNAIIAAAPKYSWRWHVSTASKVGDAGPPDALVGPPRPDGMGAKQPDAAPRGAREPGRIDDAAGGRQIDSGPLDGGPVDGGAKDGGPKDGGTTGTARLAPTELAERLKELDAVLRGFFRLLEPFYKAGVVADSEFPSKKREVRIFSSFSGGTTAEPRYALRAVHTLHRFSELRPALGKAARQFFFKTDADLRAQVVDFILERLPPNLAYAKENKQVISISEVTGVEVVLIRRGEVLARRGQIISSRAYHAIRAGVAAAEQVSPWRRAAAELGVLAFLLLLFVVTARELVGGTLSELRAQALLYGGLVVLATAGALALAYLPIHASVIPQAALAMIFGVLLGRGPALLVALVVPAALAALHVFDLASLGVGVAGGLASALVVRRRRRSGVLAAAVLVGVVQAIALEAFRASAGRPQTSLELFAAAQAFGGGILAGLVSVVALPFIQRWFGVAGQGKLTVLADFEHPLARRLRERRPEVFAHTVRVVSLADRAANAVGADRLLTRCGALYHDIGWLAETPHGSREDDDAAPEPGAAELARVAAGVALARSERIPPEVRRLLVAYRGTLPVATDRDATERDAEPIRYPGPRPRTVEGAVLMIADQVERETATPEQREHVRVVVGAVLQQLIGDGQLDDAPLTHAELRRIADALVAYLEE